MVGHPFAPFGTGLLRKADESFTLLRPLTIRLASDSIGATASTQRVFFPMGRTVDIPEEIYTQLEQQAQARGISVAQLIAQLQAEAQRARLSAAISSLQAKGLLLVTTPRSSPAELQPVQVEGVSVSEAIIRERR